MLKRINQQILLSMGLLVGSLILLFYEPPHQRASNQNSIAQVSQEFTNLNRKSEGDLDWQRIYDSEKLYAGDLIFSNENSVAQISFMDSIILDIEEYTLIKLEAQDNDPVIDVRDGKTSMRIKGNAKSGNGKVIVKMGEKSFALTGNNAKVVIEKSAKNTQITSQEGSIQMVEMGNAQSKPINLAPGESIDVASMEVTQKKACLQILKPENLEKVSFTPDSRIQFSWKSTCGQTKDTLEVSRDPKFKTLIHQSTEANSSRSIVLGDFPDGLIYWRVKNEEALEQNTYFMSKRDYTPLKVALAAAPTEKPVPVVEDEFDYEEDDFDFSPHMIRSPSNSPPPVAFATEEQFRLTEKRLNYSIGLGFSYNTYNDGIVRLNQYSLTPKLSAAYDTGLLDHRLHLIANTFFTALPITKTDIQTNPKINPAQVESISMRFWGVNARVAYQTPWLGPDWRLDLSAGWYMNTVFVTNNYFGYSSVNGPQLYPSIEKIFSKGNRLGSYIKYSPVSAGGALLDINQNYELAMGAYYVLPKAENSMGSWGISADVSKLSLNIAGKNIISESLTLGASIRF